MNSSPSISALRPLLLEQGLHLWRNKWLAVATCWLVCLLGWTAVTFLPAVYSSNARAYIDVDGLLAPLLRGLVVDTASTQSTDFLRQTLLSRPNMDQVIRLSELDQGLSAQQREALILSLSQRIRVTNQGRNLITITYSDRDPLQAKGVVEALLTIFSEQTAGSTRVAMEGARGFLDQQVTAYEEQLRSAERRRADFRKQYADYLSDASGMPKLYALEQKVRAARLEYDGVVVARDALVAQLRAVPQFLTVNSAAGVMANGQFAVASSTMRLAQAERSLEQLRLRYTDLHPDVVAAMREVDSLKKQISPDTSATGEGTTQIPNPTYEQIRLRLVDAQTAIPAAQQRLSQAMADFERVKTVNVQQPDIDAQAADLDRDYEIIKRNHDALIGRRETASLSQAADDQADRTQFRVVDPPLLPLRPSSPNLPLMFSLVLFAGIGAGGAVPLIFQLLKGTFSSVSQLRELGLPVIGSVSYSGQANRLRTTAQGVAVAGSVAALLMVYGGLMFFGNGLIGGIL